MLSRQHQIFYCDQPVNIGRQSVGYFQGYGRKVLSDEQIQLRIKVATNLDQLSQILTDFQSKQLGYDRNGSRNRDLKCLHACYTTVPIYSISLFSNKNKKHQRYQASRSRKTKLEQEFEHVELKAHEARRRMESIKTELEYTQTEEARRNEGQW